MTSDALLTELLRDMHTLIETRKPDMTQDDLERAMEWVQSVAHTCGQATDYCNQMQFDDGKARQFMGALLRAMLEATRLAILDAQQRDLMSMH